MALSTVEFSAATAEITIDGKAYKVSPLTMADRAAAERRIRDRRMSHMLESISGVLLPNEVIGKAIAEIECNTVSVDELLDTYESRIYLLFLSLRRAGETMTEKQVADLPPGGIEILGTIIRHITGVPQAKDESENPTTCKTRSTNEPKPLIGASS
jgi:hypothetical protein